MHYTHTVPRACARVAALVRGLVRGTAPLLVLAAGVAAAQAPATPASISPGAAAQIRVLTELKSNRGPQQAKIASRLHLAMLHQRGDARLAPLTDFRFVQPQADGRVAIELLLTGSDAVKPALARLEQLDAPVLSHSRHHGLVRARVRLQDLETVAALPGVRFIRQPAPMHTHGVDTSEGDLTHRALQARNTFGVTGAGVKACVVSDGIDNLADLVASEDLPAGVDVLAGQEGSGVQGSAMLEILHDLAPGAQLGFATGAGGEEILAQNILALAANGCQVIVDDLSYLNQSPFQDGLAAQAVATVSTAGVVYLSAAGDSGNRGDLTAGTWEGDFLGNGTPPVLAGAGPVHDFGDGGQSLRVESGNTGTPVVLVWAEHYDASVGTASTDYDLYVLNGALGTVFDASTDVQDGAGDDDFPIEFISGGAFGGERLVVAKFADGATSSVPMFNLQLFRGELDDALATGGAVRGHGTVEAAFSVAATPAGPAFGASGSGPFPDPFTSTNTSEVFSSEGPRRVILSPAGDEITPGNRTSSGGVVRQKPDITAADGVSTQSVPGLFYGTSAAAPHAAAIVALLKSALPAMTPAQIRATLLSTAVDIEAPGVDAVTGAGILMAEAALSAAGAAPAATLVAQEALATEVLGDGDAYVENNERWSLQIPLENVGGVDAGEVSVELTSSSAGVTILTGQSSYPDAAAGATVGNATPLVFAVEPGFPCGALIDFALEISYTGGVSPQQHAFQWQVGAPGAQQVFSYAGAAVAIPDGSDLSGANPGAVVEAALAVGGVGPLHSAAMRIDGATCSTATGATTVGIDHSFVNDLELVLATPSGTAAVLVDNADGSGNNFCQTLLDDAAVASIQGVISTQAPFSGTFQPATPLRALAGAQADGSWALRAQDFFSGDTGSIRAWSLLLTPAVCDAPVLSPQLSATKAVSGDLLPGGNAIYTITVTNAGPGAQSDNPGSELVDTLPPELTVASVSATSGTVSGAGVNPVTWDGALADGETVTITIDTAIDAGAAGSSIANQATVHYDADADGSNEASAPSDDPATAAAADPTVFTVGQGLLAITPVLLDFGDVGAGSSSGLLSVTLSNEGGAPLQVVAVDAPALPFLAAAGTCAAVPFALAAGASCTLGYSFAPDAAGPAAQDLSVSADAPGSGSFQLAGNGVEGSLQITPAAVVFAPQELGTSSAAMAVTLANTGAGALQVDAIDAATVPFERTGGSCPALPITLAPTATCTLEYTFSPVAEGAAQQAIGVSADAPGDTGFTLSGTGTAAVLALSVPAVDFGQVLVDATGQATVTLRNDGTAQLTVSSIAVPAAPFSLAGGSCGAVPLVLAAGASCTLEFAFSPSAAGAFASSVEIGSNGGDASLALAGTGAAVGSIAAVQVPGLLHPGQLLLVLLMLLAGVLVVRRQA